MVILAVFSNKQIVFEGLGGGGCLFFNKKPGSPDIGFPAEEKTKDQRLCEAAGKEGGEDS